jgi:S-methylmethionine-dependent homocysteine/selenocysteine methylase
MSRYDAIQQRLAAGGIVTLDGGTGTELERQGVKMNPDAWCGTAALDNFSTLVSIHKEYIRAGADVITVNSYASSRLMLEAAGLGDKVDEINRKSVEAALTARAETGADHVVVAGSLSHMIPMTAGTSASDLSRTPDAARMEDAFSELAEIHTSVGCELILLEMMFHPTRMPAAFKAAQKTGLPFWAGLSARHSDDGELLAFSADIDVPFEEIVALAASYNPDVMGTMHTPSNLIAGCDAIIAKHFSGPRSAYPDSGHFKMPLWQFEDVIPPEGLVKYAQDWVAGGVQIVGGCCGLSPEHIAAISAIQSTH